MINYKIFIFIASLLLNIVALNATSFSKNATIKPQLVQTGSEKHWCPVCGMDIKKFYKTSHTSKLKNSTTRQYCSMSCLVVDMQEYGIDTNSVKVVDASTQKLIDAKKAYYVMGSKVKGTMSKVSRLAFISHDDAKAFVKKYAGEIVSFDVALNKSKENLKSDILMMKVTKDKKIYPLGKKIFNKKCKKDIDLTNYIEINELKADIKNNQLCGALKEKYLQPLALYLWEVKRFGDLKGIEGTIEVTEDEKCPVCGMFTYKYPKWAAQIFYKDDAKGFHHSFDGVKDMMKFYFNQMKWGDYPTSKNTNITKMLVTDYYTQKAIDATKAFYVTGSDVYGPMGNEYIPFKNESEANNFYIDHKGVKVIKFEDIKELEVYELDK